MMLSSPYQNPISPFTIPETPRTEASSQANHLMTTPKKQKSPKTQQMEDITMCMDNANLSTASNGNQKRK